MSPAVTVRGASLRLRIDLLENVTPRPTLVVKVFNEQYGALGSINVGPLDSGTHQYTASLQGDCTSACRLLSIGASWPGPEGANSYMSLVIQRDGRTAGRLLPAGRRRAV